MLKSSSGAYSRSVGRSASVHSRFTITPVVPCASSCPKINSTHRVQIPPSTNDSGASGPSNNEPRSMCRNACAQDPASHAPSSASSAPPPRLSRRSRSINPERNARQSSALEFALGISRAPSASASLASSLAGPSPDDDDDAMTRVRRLGRAAASTTAQRRRCERAHTDAAAIARDVDDVVIILGARDDGAIIASDKSTRTQPNDQGIAKKYKTQTHRSQSKHTTSISTHTAMKTRTIRDRTPIYVRTIRVQPSNDVRVCGCIPARAQGPSSRASGFPAPLVAVVDDARAAHSRARVDALGAFALAKTYRTNHARTRRSRRARGCLR